MRIALRRPVLSLFISCVALFAALPTWAQGAVNSALNTIKLPEPLPPIEAGSAVLIVDAPANAGADTEPALHRRINTHIATLRSEQHMRKVLSLAGGETRKTKWFTAANDPLERATWLRDHLKAHVVPGTPLIEVTLNDVPDANERRAILQEICNVYLDSQRTVRGNQLLDRTQMLNTVKIKTEMRLKDLVAEMREKQVRLNIDGGSIGRVGVKEIELSKLVAEQIEAQLMYGKARAYYESVAAAIQQGQNPSGLDQLVARITPFLQNDQQQIRQLELEAKVLAIQAGENDPRYKEVAARRKVMKDAYEKQFSEATAKAKVVILEEASQEMNAMQGKLEALSKRVDNLKQDLGELSNSMVAYSNLQEEQKGLREQLKSVKQEIEQIMALQSSAGLAEIRWHLMPEVAAP